MLHDGAVFLPEALPGKLLWETTKRASVSTGNHFSLPEPENHLLPAEINDKGKQAKGKNHLPWGPG